MAKQKASNVKARLRHAMALREAVFGGRGNDELMELLADVTSREEHWQELHALAEKGLEQIGPIAEAAERAAASPDASPKMAEVSEAFKDLRRELVRFLRD